VVIDVSSKYINPLAMMNTRTLLITTRLITLMIKADRHGLGRNHVHRIAGGLGRNHVHRIAGARR